jgi:hypothetical protein
MSFAAITLCVASQRMFTILRIYLVIDSVLKLLDKPSYVKHFYTLASIFLLGLLKRQL